MIVAARFPYRSYHQLLVAIRRQALALVLHANVEWRALQQSNPPTPVLADEDLLRTIAMLTTIMQRASLLIRHIASLPVLDEERDGRIERRLDQVFDVFAKYRIDLATYYSWIDDDLRRELAADARGRVPALDADDTARRPMVLVAELCGDLGITMHILPAKWLKDTPYDFRLLCARAGSSRIGPGRAASRSVRLNGPVHLRH